MNARSASTTRRLNHKTLPTPKSNLSPGSPTLADLKRWDREDIMDTFSPKKRSWIMAQVKSTGNRSTEVEFRSVLHANKITGWRRNYALFGKPDFVFPEARLAVFLDGCFWHGHPRKCRMPQANRSYWKQKIARNVARDRRVTCALQKKAWKVIRIWEDSVKKPSTVARLRKALA